MVESLTRSLVNKMQHAPIQAIKRAAREGDRETLAVLQNLFDAPERHCGNDSGAACSNSVKSESDGDTARALKEDEPA